MTTKAIARKHQVRTAEFRGMLPVAIRSLIPAERLDFDLYIRSDEDQPALYRARSSGLKQESIDELIATEVPNLYIKVAEHEAYCEYLRNVVLGTELDTGRRFQVLAEVNKTVFESAFTSADTDKYVSFAEEYGEELANIVSSNELAAGDLCSLMSHDYYTFTHVANVTTYCVTLANEMGYSDREVLREVAVGGLLHDYGKRFVSAHTLNFPGRLTKQQFQEIQRHPLHGFCQFTQRDGVTWGQLMMIYQHHERPDGKGYPVGVTGADIHPWARICKVADVYDALTSDRPYRKADSSAEVLRFMRTKVGTEFDEEVFECFRAMINLKN